MSTVGPVGPMGPIAGPQPTAAQLQGQATAGYATSAIAGHKVLVSVGVLLVVAIFMTQVAGINKDWAVVIGLLLLGLLMQRFMQVMPSSQEQWVSTTPFIP